MQETGIEYLSALSQLPDSAMKNKKEKTRESPPICQLLPFFFRSSLFASVKPSSPGNGSWRDGEVVLGYAMHVCTQEGQYRGV
jgi:hypothetical protein